MTDPRADTVSIADRTYPVAAGAPVVAAHFLRHTAVFVLGEEAMLFVEPEGEPRRVAVHDGAILATAADKQRIVTGGDDGKVAATNAKGETEIVATDPKHRWIDHVALGPERAVAWSAGKTAFVQAKDIREFEAPSSVGGLAFLPKGFRLALAHYNGATLWFPNAKEATPEFLEWKGSHLGATVSPDGRFLVTTMQEPMLHGWRLADRKHMRMSGYASRVTSMSWTADGDWLATSGATAHPLAVPGQRRTDGQRAARVGAGGASRRGRRQSPEGSDRRRRLRRRHGALHPHPGWRRDFGPEAGQHAGQCARLEHGRPFFFPSARKTAKPAYSISPDRPERDTRWLDRHPALAFCLSMIFSENRIPLFRIML